MAKGLELSGVEVAALAAAAAAVLTYPEHSPAARELLPILEGAGAKLADFLGEDWDRLKAVVAAGRG